MTHKLIKIENYLLVVDDSEIKRGYWFYLDDAVVVARYNESKPVSSAKKIIAHLPLNGSPILEGVDLLPPIEDEYTKSLHQYPTEFECEMESVRQPPPSRGFSVVPITVISAQGVEWVGKYK